MSVYDNLILAAANVELHRKRLDMARAGQLSLTVEDAGTALERACDKLSLEAKASSWTPGATRPAATAQDGR